MKLLFTFLIVSVSLTGQTWLQLADFPGLERDDGVAVNVNDKLYFGTGLTVGFGLAKDFYELDPEANVWTPITSLPEGAQRQYACIFPAPNSFFVFGGVGVNGVLNNLYKYDIIANTWAAMAPKPGNGIYGANCLEFGDKIIIMGGKVQGTDIATNEVWEYAISSNTWSQKNNFPYGGRFRSSATVINNTGYLLFGFDNNNLWRKDMFVYNQGNDTWTKIPDFPQPNGRAYAALKPIEDKLILFGGYDSLNTYHKDVWYFDPGNNSWSQKQDFISFGRKGGMSVVSGNKFYYSCGINVTDTRLKETWVFDFPVGIKENQNNNSFLVFPNPANDILNINPGNLSSEELIYRFIDVYGREVKNIRTVEHKLDIRNLDPGIYILKIISKQTCLGVSRIIKE